MKTQVTVLVKNATLYSRLTGSLLWFIDIFRKMPVNLSIDGAEPVRLKASKTPYVFDVTPGVHQFVFTDPKAKGKRRNKALVGAILGASLEGAAGGSMVGGGIDAFNSVNNSGTNYENVANITIDEGAVLEFWCRPTRKGSVKVKEVKKKK